MSEGKTPMFAENAKYADWFEKYKPKDCKLNRQEYTEFLANYITSEQDGFVLNLNGSWGTGKTYFLKRLYTHLLQDKGHPTIYIDAWESDFTNNPLQVVCSELLEQLTALNSNMGSMSRPLKKLFGSVLKGSTVAAATYFGDKIGQKDAAVEAVKSMWDSAPDEMVDRLSAEYQEQVTAIKKIREELTGLAETLAANCSAKTPVIVLIDELDRCRPNYAIELLEVVKHFFTTEKFVFVVTSDTKQLKESIKTVYGEGFNSGVYLKRFFSRQASLPQPNNSEFIKALFPDLNDLPDHQKIGLEDSSSIYNQFCDLFSHSDFKLRDIEQVISKYKACTKHLPSKAIFSPTILIAKIAEDHISSTTEFVGNLSSRIITLKEIQKIFIRSRNTSELIEELNRSDEKWAKKIKITEPDKLYIMSGEDYNKLTELSGSLTGMDIE